MQNAQGQHFLSLQLGQVIQRRRIHRWASFAQIPCALLKILSFGRLTVQMLSASQSWVIFIKQYSGPSCRHYFSKHWLDRARSWTVLMESHNPGEMKGGRRSQCHTSNICSSFRPSHSPLNKHKNTIRTLPAGHILVLFASILFIFCFNE